MYRLTSTGWTQETTLEPTTEGNYDPEFGTSVAIDDNNVVVGAIWEQGDGSAYFFHRSGSTWTLESKVMYPGVAEWVKIWLVG